MEVLKIALIVVLVIILLLAVAFVLYKQGILSFKFLTKGDKDIENRQEDKLAKDEKSEEIYYKGKSVSIIKKEDNVVRISVSDDKETNIFGCQNGNITSFYSSGKEVEYKSINSLDRSEVIDEKAKFQEQIKEVDTDLRIINAGSDSRSEDGNTVAKTHKIKDEKSLMLAKSITLELLEGIKNKCRTIDEIEDKEVKKKFSETDSILESAGTFNSLASEYLNVTAAGASVITSILGIGSIISTYVGSAAMAHGAMMVGGTALVQGVGAASAAILGSIALPLLVAIGLGFSVRNIIKSVNGDDRADIKIQVINNLSTARKKKAEIEEEVADIIAKKKDVQADKRYRYLVDWLVVYDTLMTIDYSE